MKAQHDSRDARAGAQEFRGRGCRFGPGWRRSLCALGCTMAVLAILMYPGLVLVHPGLVHPGLAHAAETGDLSDLRRLALELVNGERRQRGLPPFRADGALGAAAQAHAEDMLRRDYYAHASPEGRTVMDRYGDAGGNRWRLVGENIARCDGCARLPRPEIVRDLHHGWMQSRPHRENILNPGVDLFGFGIAIGNGGRLFAVQTFAGPGGSGETAAGGEAKALAPGEIAPHALGLFNAVRREEGLSPLQESAALSEAALTVLARGGGAAALHGDLSGGGDVLDGLLAREGSAWRSVGLMAGRCGGCGTHPSGADIRFFRDRWLDDPGNRERLLDPRTTHLGFAIVADGDGGKRAAAILGRHR